MKKWKIDGMKELERAFKKLGKVPQPIATKSARAGGNIAFKFAKSNAPVDTGALQQGIIMRKEKSRIKGKSVYRVMPDPSKDDVFVKTSNDGKRYYYPASQEYGYLTVDGGYVPGYRFLRKSIDDNKSQIEKKVLEVASKEVDKALRG